MIWKLIAGLALAAAIAWLAPFDIVFDAATFGSPALRSVAIIALAVAGWAVGRRIELGLKPRNTRRPVLMPLVVAAATAVVMLGFDWLLRGQVHERYVLAIVSVPLALRTTLFMLRAFNENIIYRLFLGSVLVWLIGQVWKRPDGGPHTGAYWAGFTLAQAVNVWINVTALAPVTPLALVHDGLRYMTPGLVWSWLYWRRGFQSCEIACTTVHLFLQPLLTLAFA